MQPSKPPPETILKGITDEALAEHLKGCLKDIQEVAKELERRKYEVHLNILDHTSRWGGTKSLCNWSFSITKTNTIEL